MSQPLKNANVSSTVSDDGAGSGMAVGVSSEVMIGAVLFLFLVVVFVFVLYLYSRRFLGPIPSTGSNSSRARLVFVQGPNDAAARRGLDAAVLKVLPVTVYKSVDFQEPLECAVCLSELADGEEARLLPNCGHGFHLACIDMWFHSHSTCPLCRAPVIPEQPEKFDLSASEEVSLDGNAAESPDLPTNVLFWGNQDQVNTRNSASAPGAEEESPSSSGMGRTKPEGMLVIEIPRRVMEEFSSPASSLPSSKMPVEDTKSPPSARMKSFRRLLSRGKRAMVASPSPRGCGDIEQGYGGVAGEGASVTPRTPTYS